MKKILIADPLSFSGHVNYNHGIIRAISKYYDYKIIVNDYHAKKLQDKGVDESKFLYVFPMDWSIESLCKRMGKFAYHIAFRFYYLRVVLRCLRDSKSYNALLFTSIDVYSFILVSFLFKKRIIVVDHGIGEIAGSWSYRFAWRLMAKNITLIVMEDFIKQMVVSVLHNRKVFVVRHPLPEMKAIPNFPKNKDRRVVFAPSSSNSDVFLDELKAAKIPSGTIIIAKSRSFVYESEKLLYYNGFISTDDYLRYFSEADYILLPYEPDYNYRISAVLFEAICFGKKVLLLANNTLINYKEQFNNQIVLFYNCEELIDYLNRVIPDIDFSSTGIELYSDGSIAESLINVIEL